MSTTAMSLESLEFLLQHMEANRRFEILRRCPSLRVIEKSVPLNINSLVFMTSGVMINDTSYSLSIIRKYNVGEALQNYTFEDRMEAKFEVDKYGIEDMSDAETVIPGDVEIRQRRMPRREDEVTIALFENEIQLLEEDLANRVERRPNGNPRIVEQMEKSIEFAREKLFGYQRRRDNIPPNFRQFLQLTTSRIIDKQEQKTVQRYIYNKKYSETLKQLTTVIFGGRSTPICVTKLGLNFGQGVIRLPIGLKLKIEQLALKGPVGTTPDALARILHESSFPLKKLYVIRLTVADINNPIVRTAKELKFGIYLGNILQYISDIPNQRVHVITSPSEETLEVFVRLWIGLQRPIGTEYTIDFAHEPPFTDEMEEILERLNGVPIDDENMIIPMNDATQIKVSYGPFPEFAPRSKWAVKLLNEAVEH